MSNIKFIIKRLIRVDGYFGIAVKGIAFSIIFFGIMFKFGMNEYEEQLFLTPLKRIKNRIISRENLI